MAARDPHRFVNELDTQAIERLIARLEGRARDAVFTGLFDKYAAQLDLPACADVLEVGCGTGANVRFLARRDDFAGTAYGVDQCPHFIEAAIRFSCDEQVGDQVEFRVGDAHQLDFPDGSFDVVIAHTVISHVSDPAAVLKEMARVVRPGGRVVIFDGDYASLTYACPDHDFGQQMDAALANATFNNPRIMRELPKLLPGFDLELQHAWGDAVAEIGTASYFRSFAETYVPYVVQAGSLPESSVDEWLQDQRRAMDDGTFFACCNYYTFIARRA